MDEQRHKSAHDVVEEIQRLNDAVKRARTMEELRPLFYEGGRLAGLYPDDPFIQSLHAEFKQAVAERGSAIQRGLIAPAPGEETSPPAPESTFPELSVPPSVRDVSAAVRTPSGEMPAPPDARDVPPAQDTPASPTIGSPVAKAPLPTGIGRHVGPQRGRPPSGPHAAQGTGKPSGKLPYLVAGFAAVLLVVLAAIGLKLWTGGGGGRAGTIPVLFETTPPGAPIRVDHQLRCQSNCTVDLEPGEHKLEVILDGYEPHISTILVGEDGLNEVRVVLTPRPQTVRFFTDLSSGVVTLDGEEAGALQDGQLILDSVPPGDHEVTVKGGGSEVAFSFRLTPGKPPELTSPIQARNVLGVVFANAGDTAVARSSKVPLAVAVGGSNMGEIGPDGLVLTGLSPGSHEVRLGSGSDQQKIVAQFGPAPTLTAFLKLDINAGTLVVVTEENDVEVSLNGRPLRGGTRDGMRRIAGLPVADYTVSVSKPGYEAPPPQQVAVRKGEETRVEFRLKPIPQMATLRIRGGLAGTQVLLDSTPIGAVQSDGTFSNAAIPPGTHTIELRRDRHQSRRIQKQFSAGHIVELTEADVALEKLPGLIRLSLHPPDSTVMVRRPNQQESRVVKENPFTLPEGQWVIVASATNHMERSATVNVQAGESISLELSLPSIVVEQRPKSFGMESWAQADTWVSEGQWLVKRGGELVPYEISPVNGTFVFTATMLRGRRLMWVVNMRDPRNYVLMEMDRDEFKRKLVSDGRSKELYKRRHNLGDGGDRSIYTISVDIRPDALIQRAFKGGSWIELDNWQNPGMNLSGGKFGFLVPSNDRLGVSNFTYTARQ
jgi:hypothetical protein